MTSCPFEKRVLELIETLPRLGAMARPMLIARTRFDGNEYKHRHSLNSPEVDPFIDVRVYLRNARARKSDGKGRSCGWNPGGIDAYEGRHCDCSPRRNGLIEISGLRRSKGASRMQAIFAGGVTMDKFIARENILRYRTALRTEADPTRQKMLNDLLAIEEAKLVTLAKTKKPAASSKQ